MEVGAHLAHLSRRWHPGGAGARRGPVKWTSASGEYGRRFVKENNENSKNDRYMVKKEREREAETDG